MLNLLTRFFPSITWHIKTDEKILFLTFDDGPVPEATPDVLDLLSKNQAKATFFCIGNNIQLHPEIFRRIINEGHAIANHTYNHLDGWYNSRENYLENVSACEAIMKSEFQPVTDKLLFRPPYGRLKFSQYTALRKKNKIVMWDVLTRDWEEKRSAGSCFDRVKRQARPGSIIVFHDSIKAKTRMLPALEETLQHFRKSGYQFMSLEKYI